MTHVGRALSNLVEGTLDLVFAPVCVACHGAIPTSASERGVCATCWARVRPVPLPRCHRCSTPLPALGAGNGPADCTVCPDLRPALRCVRSAFLLEGPVRGMVHALKYRGWHSVGRAMAARMAATELPPEAASEIETVVPIPLAPARLRQRGYNQAAVLAREVALRKQLEYGGDILVKRPGSGSQTTLHPAQRRANVAGAFRVEERRGSGILARHVLLVDDVWTTGATALAGVDALLAAGARAVTVLTFARALPELERHARRLELLVHY